MITVFRICTDLTVLDLDPDPVNIKLTKINNEDKKRNSNLKKPERTEKYKNFTEV